MRGNAVLSKVVLCNSRASQQMLIQKFGVDENITEVIYNGLSALSIDKNQTCSTGPHNRLLYVGRLESNKGVHVLLRAMRLLKPKNITLDIVGDGSLKDRLQALASSLGANNVSFLGRVPNIRENYSKYNLVVIPSIREPLGNVAIEAAYSRVPVLVSSVDGLPEIVRNNETGFTISPKNKLSKEYCGGAVPLPELVYFPEQGQLGSPLEVDFGELAEKIEEVLNREDLEKITSNAYENVIENYRMESYYSKLMKVYKKYG